MEMDRIVTALAVVAVAWLLAARIRATRRRIRAAGGNEAVKSHDNYNLDLRRFRVEALRRPIWWAWLIGGLVVCAIPVVIGSVAIAVGLALCWLLLMIALSGTVMAKGSIDAGHSEAHKLIRQSDGSPLRELSARFAWTRLFGAVEAEQATHVLHRQAAGFKWWLFRYSFEHAPKRSRRELYQYSVCAVTIDKPVPRLVIDGGDVYDFNEFIPRESRVKVTLEGSFGKRYAMYIPRSDDSENRLLALSTMTPDMMALYETHFDKSVMIIEGRTILLLTRRDLFADGSYKEFYDGLDSFARKLVRQGRIRDDIGRLQKA